MSALPTATEALIKELAATTTSFKVAQDELLAEMAPEIRKGWAARAGPTRGSGPGVTPLRNCANWRSTQRSCSVR